MPSNLLIGRKEAGEREGERHKIREERDGEVWREGKEGRREVGEINSKECCGWMTGNKTVELSASNLSLCVL